MPEDIKELDLLQKKQNDIETGNAKTSFLSKITIEPALGGATFSLFLSQTSLQNFYLETICLVDLGLPKEICSWNGTGEVFKNAEIDSQTLFAQVNINRGFIAGLISTIVVLFLGPWSDYSGRRKPLILLSLGSMAVACANVLLMLSISRPSITYVIYSIQIPVAIGGGLAFLLSATFDYVGDICYTSGRDIASAIGSCRATMQASMVLGAMLGPMLQQKLGFHGVFGITVSIQIFSFIYVCRYVTDVKVNKDNKVGIFNIRLPYEAAKCLFRQRQGRRRCIIMSMLIGCVMYTIILSADMALSYMYFRNKFAWTDVIFVFFVAYKNVLNFLGTIVALRLMRPPFGATVQLLGVVGSLSFCVSMVTLIGAETTIVAFISQLIGLLSQGALVVQRPILNNQIEAAEQGKISSIMTALGTFVQLAAVPALNLLYTATAATAPDAFLGVTLLAGAAMALTFLVVDGFYRNVERLSESHYDIPTPNPFI